MNQNVLFNWSQLAYDVFKTEGAYWDHADIGFDAAFGAGHYNDLVCQFTHQTDGQTDVGGSSASAWTSSSGLRQASTWDEVLADATADLSQQRKRLSSRALGNITSGDLIKAHDVAAALGDKYANPVDWETYNDLIFYTYANATDQRGGEQFYYYDSFIMAFYDFEYVPVVNGNTYLVITATSNERFHVVYHINDGLYSYVNGANQTYGLDEHGFGNGYVNDEDLTKLATLDVRVEAPNSIEAPSVQNPSEGDGSEASGSSESPDSEAAANDAVTGDATTPESGAAVDEATAPVEDASVAEDVAADAATPDDGYLGAS